MHYKNFKFMLIQKSVGEEMPCWEACLTSLGSSGLVGLWMSENLTCNHFFITQIIPHFKAKIIYYLMHNIIKLSSQSRKIPCR